MSVHINLSEDDDNGMGALQYHKTVTLGDIILPS